jgi:hypothetical protein
MQRPDILGSSLFFAVPPYYSRKCNLKQATTSSSHSLKIRYKQYFYHVTPYKLHSWKCYYKYYVFGHYPLSCLYLKHRPGYFLDKDKTMDNVQNHNTCTNVPSSQTFRSYIKVMLITKESIIYPGGNPFGPSLTFPVLFLVCLEDNHT